jgi:O-acetylhomoserine (thiol)-lyase
MKTRSLTTGIVHSDREFGVEHGGLHKPIHTSVQFGFERTEGLIGVFQGTVKNAWNYARQGTPTSSALESLINRMEGGRGTICFTTGMAGICEIGRASCRERVS